MTARGEHADGASVEERAEHLTKREREFANAQDVVLETQARAATRIPGADVGASDDPGYYRRELADGRVDYVSEFDQWNSPDEAQVRAHVADYRARQNGYIQG